MRAQEKIAACKTVKQEFCVTSKKWEIREANVTTDQVGTRP